MAGSKFQYDESGGTFFYFLLSFLALILIPSSYYFWPNWRDKEDECEKTAKQCHCERCRLKKSKLVTKEPWKKKKQVIHAVLITLGWLAFAATAYKVSHLDRDYVDWDPFAILEIDRGATTSEIKHAYRRLSLIYHPDKQSGDSAKFLQLTKAHAALTDDEAKRNWELYGNPDGPGAMSFGIALPSWIVEKENSIWVLGLYALVFMVALPTVVWIWWRRSIQYGGDQILLDTTKLYYFYISKTPVMNLKRMLMVLAGSLEFWKAHNGEVIERPSDNLEIPSLIKKFDGFGEKNKEPPLCYSYSVKARALLFAHLHRLELPPLTIEQDRLYIVKKCPFLIHELVQCISQIMMIALSGHVSSMPPLDTLENCMRLSPMIIQALWDNKNPLLQLPHIQDDMLRYFVNKSRPIRNIRQLVNLRSTERRNVLRVLQDEEYDDVMNVCSKMPHIEMEVIPEVLDDDKPTTITAGAIVTVTVFLTRRNLDTQFGQDVVVEEKPPAPGAEEETVAGAEGAVVVPKKTAPVWKKQHKKKGKGGGGGSGKSKKKNFTKFASKKTPAAVEAKPEDAAKTEGAGGAAAGEPVSARTIGDNDDSSLGSELEDSDSDSERGSARPAKDSKDSKKDAKEAKKESGEGGAGVEEDDDDDDDEAWRDIQSKLGNKETNIDGKSLKSHTVHCPYFPDEKQEHWWLYIVDLKLRIIKMPPEHITDLEREKKISLRFTAPDKVGVFNYMVHLRSDSYIDCDLAMKFKLDVQPGLPTPIIEYGLSEDEKEEENSDSEVLDTDDDELTFSDSD